MCLDDSVESNNYQSIYDYYHGLWQGQISRLWIANNAIEAADDDGTTYPSGATHIWPLSETDGNTFTATVGGVDGTGETK